MCVCANVLGVWIRNPLRVVYLEDGIRPGGGERVLSDRFAFAHGCLDGHLLAGEEAFVLERRAEDDSVWYGVCAFSNYPRTRSRRRGTRRSDSYSGSSEGIRARR